MGISATITVHLTQDYGYDLHIAYYFFATWSTGQTVGNCFSPCMIPYTRPLLKIAMVGQMLSLAAVGPTNIIPPADDLSRETTLILLGVGLFFLGLSSAALQTLGNIESVVRAQKWAAKEYPGQDVSSLITNVQSWVIVFIGLGEGMGQLIGSFVYERLNFRWQCDVFNICVICGLIGILFFDRNYIDTKPVAQENSEDKEEEAQKPEG